MLEAALLTGRVHFVDLLLDFNQDGSVNDFDDFVSLDRLRSLYYHVLTKDDIQCKLLRRMTKQKKSGGFSLRKEQLLPQMGRLIHLLMGNHYRLLFQEEFKYEGTINIDNEEAVWYMMLWAILANEREIAEAFMSHTSCTIGAALVAYKMFFRLSLKAEQRGELEHSVELRKNAEHFETIAVRVINRQYNEDREQAYANLVSKLPFDWGRYVTPLTIAEEGGAQTFMGHACVQTLLDRIWHHYMDPNVSFFKLMFAWCPLMIKFIVFDPRLLQYGSFKETLKLEIKHVKGLDRRSGSTFGNDNQVGVDPDSSASSRQQATSKLTEADWIGGTNESVHPESSDIYHNEFVWWTIRMFYTAPVNKFAFHLLSYVAFLIALTHFLLTELKPTSGISEVSFLEWFIVIYYLGLLIEDVVQLLGRRSSGPLYNLDSSKIQWSKYWNWLERLRFFFRYYKISHWLSEQWNIVDVLMHATYITAFVLRFTVGALQFNVVRLAFVATLLICYLRFLRYLSVWFFIGPRLVTIGRMISDLFKFMLIFAVFIVSFGIAFQALLDPNQPPGLAASIGILWRPYWQLYDTLYLEDVMDDDGHRIIISRNCTYYLNKPGQPFCDHWVMPLLIATYKVVTIIILLNLLIAIFSHSFNVTEEQSLRIWRYQLGQLIREYYYQVWLPPPLNIICHIGNFILWITRKNKGSENHLYQETHRRREVKDRKHKTWIRSKVIYTQEEKIDEMLQKTHKIDENVTWISQNLQLQTQVWHDQSQHYNYYNAAEPTNQERKLSHEKDTIQATGPPAIKRRKNSTPDPIGQNSPASPHNSPLPSPVSEPIADKPESKKSPFESVFMVRTTGPQNKQRKRSLSHFKNGRPSTMLSSQDIECIKKGRVQAPNQVRKRGGTL